MTVQGNIVPSLEELLWSWPSVIRRAPDDWSRNFAKSISKQSKRKNWRPSDKQLGIMRRMVSDLYRDKPVEEAEEWNPIEDDEEEARGEA